MVSTYGSIRPFYPTSVFLVAAAAGGSITTAGSINIRIQGRNRAGRNVLSDAIAVSYTAGQKIQVTLNLSLRQSGEDLFKVVIAGERTGNATDAVDLLVWDVREADQITLKALPVTLELSTDASITTTGKPSAYIASTTAVGGCDRSLDDLSGDIISPPSFPVQGTTEYAESIPIVLWFSNGLTEDGGTPIPTGTALNLQVAVDGSPTAPNGQSYSAIFSNLLKYQILGIVRRSTGERDETISSAEAPFQVEAPLLLPVPLNRGYAVAVAIKLAFKASDLSGAVPQGAGLSIKLYSQGLFGFYSPAGFLTGDIILPDGDRLRVVPELGGFRRLGGAALVKNFQTPLLGEATFTGLAADTPAQKLCFNAAKAGEMRVGEPGNNEAIRAIASTAPGTYTASGWSNPVTVSANDGISVTVAYPVVNGRGVIRGDYPDERIRGNSQGAFNVPKLRAFVEFDGNLYELEAVTVVPGQASQTFSFADLGSTTIASLPVASSADFCLFGYGAGINIVPAPGIGTLSAGTYRVAIAYDFPSPNFQIAALSHEPAGGCVKEMSGTFDELVSTDEAQTFEKNQFYTPKQLDSAASIFLSASESASFYLDLAHNATIENAIAPTGVSVSFSIEVTQTGPFTLGFGSDYVWADGVAPTISPTIGAILRIDCSRLRGSKFLSTFAEFLP